MTAEASAARAKDPDRISIDAAQPATGPLKAQEERIQEKREVKHDNTVSPSPFGIEAADTSSLSARDSMASTSSASKFQNTTSLPPEILGLYNRKDDSSQTSPTPPIQEDQGRSQESLHESDSLGPPVEGLGAIGAPRDHLVTRPIWGPATLDSCPVIMIPKNFQPKQGVKLTDDLVVGTHISSGLQGGVYDLLNLDGSKANMLFKIVHTHAPLAEVEREWEVGMRLNQLAEHDGSLPGFMGVGAGIRGGGKFKGMLLERLNGGTVDKIICTRDFHDVQYVYAMLYSVFTALDRAQGALGFHHSDLRLANVMEIRPPDEMDDATNDSVQGTATEQHLDADISQLQSQSFHDPDPDLVLDKLRFQFKIIDYGLANFDETFAAGPDVVLEDDRESVPSRRSINLQRQHSISPATGCVAVFPFPMIKKERLGDLPSTSALEKLYRFMWRRKGDVYHLVFELGEWLDGRVWPLADQLDVLRLVDFVEHVTGVRMKCWFSEDMTGEDSVGGWRDRACGPFERHDSGMHFLRRWSVRLRSWINPSNPGITAAEALTAPFFTKRISLRGVIHGCSTRYSKWTKTSKRWGNAPRPTRDRGSLGSPDSNPSRGAAAS